MRTLLSDHERQGSFDFEATESFVRDRMLRCGAIVVSHVLRLGDGSALPQTCPCGGTWRTVKRGDKTVLTVVGDVRIRRHIRQWAVCGNRRAAEDEAPDMVRTGFSPGVRRMMALTGGEMSFDKARELMWELARVRVAAKDVGRKAEEIGAHIYEMSDIAMRDVFLGNNADACGEGAPEILYLEADGTGVPVMKPEVAGRRGKGSDGTARTREAKIGAVFAQTGSGGKGEPVRDSDSTSHIARIETAESFGNRLYAEAVRRGLGRSARVVVLGDGAARIWGMAAPHFPMALQIVDYWHAAEHLWELAKVLFATDESRKTWVEPLRECLWEGDVESIVVRLGAMRLKGAKRKARDREVAYFENNIGRMRYADFRAQGLFIGSGVVEAGCKSLVGQRLKRSGMRWTVRGANAILALRCCLASGQFEDYWENRRAA